MSSYQRLTNNFEMNNLSTQSDEQINQRLLTNDSNDIRLQNDSDRDIFLTPTTSVADDDRNLPITATSTSNNNATTNTTTENNNEEGTANQTLMRRVQNQARYTLFNAPLLRFLNRNNRYAVLPNGQRIIGETNDGVFSNMSAKPTVSQEDSNINDTRLPTYEEASNDPTPPYWEAAIMAGYDDEIFVEGLPVGNLLNFFWNMMVSISFQFVGFVITYLLHTSHAAKNGSQTGLGFTLISYGLSALPLGSYSGSKGDGDDGINENKFEPDTPNSIDVDHTQIIDGSIDQYSSDLNGASSTINDDSNSSTSNSFVDTPFFSYALIALGVFITLKAIHDFFRAKRKERQILTPQTGPAVVV